jgi:hypothetical protein
MKKRTKLLILTAILGLAFILTACNFSANNTDKNKKKTTNTNTPTNTPSGESPVNPDEELEAIELPLTLQAITNGNIIISGRNAFEKMQIQKNDGLIIDATENVFVQAGDKIRFYASGYKYKTDGSNNLRINSTADCYVYGNAMSLIYYTDFAGKTEIADKYVLQKLFINNTHIKNHVSLDVVLPATTLSESCYKMMFYGCTGITRAPELPAPTLTKDCYNHMFFNCNNLNSIKCMAADVSAQNCTTNWLVNVAAAGNFTSVQQNSIWKAKDVCSGIPKGWTANPPFILPNAKEIPLTLEAIEAGTITLTNPGEFNYLKYSKNNGEKTDASDTIEVNAGDKICFFANGPADTDDVFLQIDCSNDCYIYGNIMSLIDPADFSTKIQLTEAKTFKSLFSGNSHIKNCSIGLVLPATELQNNCYEEMFKNCTALAVASGLPAVTLEESCYAHMYDSCSNLAAASEISATTLAKSCCTYMFSGCISLAAAPELPAEALAQYCYAHMFDGCSHLITVPARLPATTLQNYCYEYMFQGCTDLKTPPELPADTLANFCYRAMFCDCTNLIMPPTLNAQAMYFRCYSQMFQNCTSLTYAPYLPATTLWSYCYEYMFQGCTNLKSAPAMLPATTLEPGCYSYMFDGCSNLTTAPALPADKLQNNCYEYMFQNCTSLTIAPELIAEDWSNYPDYCYKGMFKGCSKLQYVVCKAKTYQNSSTSSIFSSWLTDVAAEGILITPKPNNFSSNTNVKPPAKWKIEKQLPLTLEAIQDGTITITNADKFNNMCYYCNYKKITNLSSEEVQIPVTAGDKIFIFADGQIQAYSNYNITDYLNIQCNSDCYLYGNVMSLAASSNYGEVTTIPNQYFFLSLFRNNQHIKNHPKELLLLPATTLKEGCYEYMFRNSSLSTAPELSALTLANSCYEYMFADCSSLTNVPVKLPATSLKERCYYYMFCNCILLEKAPVLPATTTEIDCYKGMFYGCSKLNYIKCLARKIGTNAENCYMNWTYGVSQTGTFVKHNDCIDAWRDGTSGIPSNWVVEEASE